MSLAPVTEEQGLYEQKLPTILNEMLEHEEEHLFSHGAPAPSGEKKRRLKVEQVKALEKNFELENKLDPMKKLEIANELGLQPRQVAVWYQNRRARWKTKQLERDFAALRSNYDSLAADCNSLRRDRDALLAQIEELKAKLGETKKMKGGSSDSGEFDFNESLEWRVQRCFFAKEEEEEEEGFLAGEETCFDVFSEEQNPGFSWYGSDHWS